MDDPSYENLRPWNTYSSPDPTPSQTAGANTDQEAPHWKNFGSSMNAISFGFVATAILISMFLIMAIFEHLFRPNPSLSSTSNQDGTDGSLPQLGGSYHVKLGNPPSVSKSTYASNISVVMAGHNYPTYVAKPAPLPCSRENIRWPSHDRKSCLLPR